MNTRKFFLSLLLLVTATFMSGVLAQSAEDAVKYGQLQEIQIPAAGKLGKYIKKKDPNVTALKISGELNAKDWDVLYSLPNVAYLDLQNVTNVASVYKFKDNQGYHVEVELSDGQILLNLPNTLKFLAVPQGAKNVLLPDDINYTFDMLVLGTGTVFIGYKGWYGKLQLNEEFGKDIKFTDIKVTATNSIQDANPKLIAFLKEHYARQNATTTSQCDPEWLNERIRKLEVEMGGNGIVSYVNSKFSQSIEGRINDYTNCKTLYIQGDGQYCNCDNIYPKEIVIQSTGDRILRQYTGNAKRVDLSDYSYIYAYAFKNSTVEIVNTGDKITEIPNGCFVSCENLKEVAMPSVKTIRSNAFYDCPQLRTISMPAIDYIEQYAFDSQNIALLSTIDYTYKVPADSLNIEIASFIGTGVKKIDLLAHPYAPNLTNTSTGYDYSKFYNKFQQEVICLIPNGSRKHRYNTGGWQELRVVEQGAKKSYAFRLDSIGSLKNYLTEDIVLNVDSLTLSGFMDETEFALIRQCKYLRYLDITNLFTFASVEVAKANLSKSIALARFVAALSNMQNDVTQAKYQNYEVDTETALRSEFSNKILQKLVPDKVSNEELDEIFGVGKIIPSDECYFPEGALEGLIFIEEIYFPNKLLSIQRQNLFIHKDINPFTGREAYDTRNYTRSIQRLKKVRLSNELHTLGDFLFADSPLEEINFPDSLKIVGFYCFKNCNLSKVDLSRTNISTYQFSRVSSHDGDIQYLIDTNSKGLPLFVFSGSPLQELRLPKKLTNVEWMGDQLSTSEKENEIVLYVYFKEPYCTAAQMAGAYGEIKEIHIPRGTKAAWRGYPNVIDDIDL